MFPPSGVVLLTMRLPSLLPCLQEDQIRLYGLPIRPAFSRKYPPKEKLRKSLQMDPRKPAILLVGGGEGMGPVERTVEALSKVRPSDVGVGVWGGNSHEPSLRRE